MRRRVRKGIIFPIKSKKEKYREGEIRWTNIAITQLGNSISVLITLATATLAYLFSFFEKTIHLLESFFFLAVFFIAFSLLSGIAVFILRALDFRYTRRIWNRRNVGEFVEAKNLRKITRELGYLTWVLFATQAITFGLGVIFTGIHVFNYYNVIQI